MKYLTLNQYKMVSDGIGLSDVTDMTLAMMITRAEAAIDSHMGFDLKRGGFEPHTVMYQTNFDSTTLKVRIPNFPVPVRLIDRYRIQVSNLSTTGAGFFANINAGDCVINNDGMYVEIVPLQAVTYSLSPILLQLGLRPPISQVDAELGFYIPTFGEQLFCIDGAFDTYYATHGFWAQTYVQSLAAQPNTLPPVPPVVYVNGVVQSSGYSVNYAEGAVTFSPKLTSSAIVTADFTRTIPDEVMYAMVEQVTHQLSLRAANKLGLYHDISTVKSGDQEIVREALRGKAGFTELSNVLCPAAVGYLDKYKEIPLA